MNASGLTGAPGKHERSGFDYYPTPPECTIALLEWLKPPPMIVWEPAAGKLHISKVLEAYGHHVLSTDILTGNDYLSNRYTYTSRLNAIITNPPFSLADKFIDKAVTEAPLVCMLLKCQYFHAKSRFALFQRHTPAAILPLSWRPDFISNRTSGSPTMNFSWYVWKRGDRSARYQPLPKPETSRRLEF